MEKPNVVQAAVLAAVFIKLRLEIFIGYPLIVVEKMTDLERNRK